MEPRGAEQALNRNTEPPEALLVPDSPPPKFLVVEPCWLMLEGLKGPKRRGLELFSITSGLGEAVETRLDDGSVSTQLTGGCFGVPLRIGSLE